MQFQCKRCKYTAGNSKDLGKHINRKHSDKGGGRQSKIICIYSECSSIFATLEKLDWHLADVHSKEIEKEEHTFLSENDFNDWKNELKAKKSLSFVVNGNKGGKKVYLCNRSSTVARKPKGKGLRNRKINGRVATDKVCTSRIIKYDKNDEGVIKVIFFKRHTHLIDPGKCGLTSPQKRTIAEDCKKGLSKKTILAKAREEGVNSENLTRYHLLSREDIDNIRKKYNLASDIQLHSNDAISVDITVQVLKDKPENGVFLYKKFGIINRDYPELLKDDFCLAYMTNHQQSMLQLYGDNIICIDGTHGTNSYGIEMTTVLVINKNYESFPVMFVFHKSKLGQTYDLIFRKMKERVGCINSKVFMSDDEPAFFTAWKNNMGNVEHKLLCTWHVLKNWNKHCGASNELWQRLRELILETDIVTFQRYMTELDDYLTSKDCPKLTKFREYFNKYYKERVREWAGCYRTHLGINTNMSLENLHRELKYVYLNGKKCKRLDEAFAAVRAFLRDRHYARIIALYRGTVTSKHRKLRSGHKESKTMSTSNVFCSGDHYLVASSKDIFRYYTITKAEENCGCNVKCFECDECVHSYWCGCYESSVRNNMCKHIHLLIRFLNEKKKDCEGCIENCEDDDEDRLYIATSADLEAKHEEKKIHVNALSYSSAKPSNIDLSEFHQLLNSIKTLEEQKLALRMMRKLKEDLDFLRGEKDVPEKITEIDTSKTRVVEKQPRFENKLTRKKKNIAPDATPQIMHARTQKSFHPVAPEEESK